MPNDDGTGSLSAFFESDRLHLRLKQQAVHPLRAYRTVCRCLHVGLCSFPQTCGRKFILYKPAWQTTGVVDRNAPDVVEGNFAVGFQTPPDRRAVVTVTTDGYETKTGVVRVSESSVRGPLAATLEDDDSIVSYGHLSILILLLLWHEKGEHLPVSLTNFHRNLNNKVLGLCILYPCYFVVYLKKNSKADFLALVSCLEQLRFESFSKISLERAE